jgi:hypothetical protein
MRNEAPLISVKVTMLENANAAYPLGIEAFIGRGDVLALDDLADYGIKLRSGTISTYLNQEEIDELFSVDTLAPGEDRPVMVTVPAKEGSVVRVPLCPTPGRRIRIRKPT